MTIQTQIYGLESDIHTDLGHFSDAIKSHDTPAINFFQHDLKVDFSQLSTLMPHAPIGVGGTATAAAIQNLETAAFQDYQGVIPLPPSPLEHAYVAQADSVNATVTGLLTILHDTFHW